MLYQRNVVWGNDLVKKPVFSYWENWLIDDWENWLINDWENWLSCSVAYRYSNCINFCSLSFGKCFKYTSTLNTSDCTPMRHEKWLEVIIWTYWMNLKVSILANRLLILMPYDGKTQFYWYICCCSSVGCRQTDFGKFWFGASSQDSCR